MGWKWHNAVHVLIGSKLLVQKTFIPGEIQEMLGDVSMLMISISDDDRALSLSSSPSCVTGRPLTYGLFLHTQEIIFSSRIHLSCNHTSKKTAKISIHISGTAAL